MKWEVRKVKGNNWGIFLMQEYCKTDEPVCYAVSSTEKAANQAAGRLNNPIFEETID